MAQTNSALAFGGTHQNFFRQGFKLTCENLPHRYLGDSVGDPQFNKPVVER